MKILVLDYGSALAVLGALMGFVIVLAVGFCLYCVGINDNSKENKNKRPLDGVDSTVKSIFDDKNS